MEKILFFQEQDMDEGHKGRKPFPYAIMIQNTHANGVQNVRKIGTATDKKDLKVKIRSFAEAMGAAIDDNDAKVLAKISLSKPKAKAKTTSKPASKPASAKVEEKAAVVADAE